MKKRFLACALSAVVAAAALAGCGVSVTTDDTTAAETEAETTTAEAAETTAEEIKTEAEEAAEDGDKTIGFVTFGLGGDFFQQLADTYVEVMEADGWEATYTDGSFDPTTQIEQCENYIAMGVDVLVCWSVAPEAMDAVIAECEEAGIKFIAFVAETSSYDACMLSENAVLADYCDKLAAKWIDETFADAEDHSVEVVVFSCRAADTGVVQADELLKIEEYSTKAKLVKEVECQEESADEGMTNAETLFLTDPDVKVILTPHSAIATGVNSYLTSLSSPITDYSDMGVFAINGDTAMAELIKSSVDNESPMRGMVLTGSVNDTACDIRDVVDGVMDGSLEYGYKQYAGTTFVYADTVDEYLETGKVTSVSNADFD